MLPAAPALAQHAGKYFMADGTKTDDEKAAASWLTPEFWKNPEVATMNAQYAYAWGITGKGMKVGVMDMGTALQHPQFKGRDHIGLPLSVPANPGSLEKPDPKCSTGFASKCVTEGRRTTPMVACRPIPHGGTEKQALKIMEPNGGILVAKRDGVGVHGGAFDAQLFAVDFPNMGLDEEDISNLNGPGALLAYRALITSHVKLIAYEIQYGKASGMPSSTDATYLSDQYWKYSDHGALQGPREAAAKRNHYCCCEL